MPTRRDFLAASAVTLFLPANLFPQAATDANPRATPQATHLNLAAIDHARILAAAARAVARVPSANRDLRSDAYLNLTLDIPALAAASMVDPASAPGFAEAARTHLTAWFTAPETRLPATPANAMFEPLLDLMLLAEVAQALPLLALDLALAAALKLWFREYLTYLTTARTALLARDARDHHGSSWLLQTAAYAHLLADEGILTECRHRFKTATLRAQINASGLFPHELTSENPYRDSLYNLDLLAGVCLLLSTRFESMWNHELQDGPGMRVAIARHVPYIRNRATWAYPADKSFFNQLPCRRPALLFAARAYSEPEYAALWQTLNPDPTEPAILRTFPVRQPILWLAQASARP